MATKAELEAKVKKLEKEAGALAAENVQLADDLKKARARRKKASADDELAALREQVAFYERGNPLSKRNMRKVTTAGSHCGPWTPRMIGSAANHATGRTSIVRLSRR